MPELRPYQREAIDGLHQAFRDGMRRPMCVIPTGGGKSIVIATFVREAMETWDGTRILMLTHVKELVAQNAAALCRVWPKAPLSIYSAGLGRKDLSGQVVYGSIQSVFRRGADMGRVDLVIVDEAHLIPPSGDGMYRRLLDDLGAANGNAVPMVGFTATPYRLTTGSLLGGRGQVFDGLGYEVGIVRLIEEGYLVPLVTKGTETKLDTRGVARRGGEYVESALQAAVDVDELTRSAVAEILEAGRDRNSWLVFSTGVKHAHHICDAIRAAGVAAAVVSGATPQAERDYLVAAHKSGKLRCLVNDSVLTTGYDNPMVDLLACLRPTESKGLWVQICGRGTRLSPDTGKVNCLVLDFGGNGMKHGPIDLIEGDVKGPPGEAPIKECPNCRSIIFAGLLKCPDCGFDFEIVRERKSHSETADDVPLLSTQAAPVVWHRVARTNYSVHPGRGDKPATMRVDYYTGRMGLKRFSEWVCIGHAPGSHGRRAAERWWRARSPEPAWDVPPDDVATAVEYAPQLLQPVEITTYREGEFHRVGQVRLADEAAKAA